MNLDSDHLPILISLQMDLTINPKSHRTSFNLKNANWDQYRKILRTILLKAASLHIPSLIDRINTEPVPVEILEMTRARDDLRSRDLARPATDEHRDHQDNIRNTHGDSSWRHYHKTDPSKLWRTIKAIDGKSSPKAENEAITFDDTQVSSPKQIANYFNRKFTTSKLGIHTSSRETRLVSREIKQKSLMSVVTFTTDQVTKGISNCSNIKYTNNKLIFWP